MARTHFVSSRCLRPRKDPCPRHRPNSGYWRRFSRRGSSEGLPHPPLFFSASCWDPSLAAARVFTGRIATKGRTEACTDVPFTTYADISPFFCRSASQTPRNRWSLAIGIVTSLSPSLKIISLYSFPWLEDFSCPRRTWEIVRKKTRFVERHLSFWDTVEELVANVRRRFDGSFATVGQLRDFDKLVSRVRKRKLETWSPRAIRIDHVLFLSRFQWNIKFSYRSPFDRVHGKFDIYPTLKRNQFSSIQLDFATRRICTFRFRFSQICCSISKIVLSSEIPLNPYPLENPAKHGIRIMENARRDC